MEKDERSAEIFAKNRKFIPGGGVVSHCTTV